MVVEARSEKLIEEEEEAARTKTFPLFGFAPVTGEDAWRDGVDLVAARVGMFSNRIQSEHEHFQPKKDHVEHIHNGF